jgi:hypothetical protein
MGCSFVKIAIEYLLVKQVINRSIGEIATLIPAGAI